jgi:20S proteasome subunit beta 2
VKRSALEDQYHSALANIHPQIHYITESIRCCGAGTAADTEFTTASISSNMELHALSTGRKPRVVTVMTMLKQYLFQ